MTKISVHCILIIKVLLVIILFISRQEVVLGYSLLNGVTVTPATISSNTRDEQESIDLGQWLVQPQPSATPSSGQIQRTLLIFGTYAADFNMIEYGQRIRYYYPILQEPPYNVTRCGMIINCQNSQVVRKFKQYIDVPDGVELFYDPKGFAGKTFGVSRGWLPENSNINPFIKLFGMLFGLGAYATLPAVISGYVGNPFVKQPWITDALTVGNMQQRWPMNALEINNTTTDDNDATILSVKSKFDDLPLVGTWGRRPLELATLRLQSMMGISLSHWEELQPNQEALDAGILTQLGGCLIIEHNCSSSNDADCKVLYDWKDPGICAVANFEDILAKL